VLTEALCYFWNFALGVPLQLENSIVFYYCRKICHGYTRHTDYWVW